MTLVVDMNLSPSWVPWLTQRGFEAIHWSTVGLATAPDDDILSWARERGFVVVTNDLDFSAILTATGGNAPSVVQIRTQSLLSESTVDVVVAALVAHQEQIEQGALLSIEESRTRVRLLPLRPFDSPPGR